MKFSIYGVAILKKKKSTVCTVCLSNTHFVNKSAIPGNWIRIITFFLFWDFFTFMCDFP